MIRFGLGKRIRDLFSRNSERNALLEELEDALIEGDIGASLTSKIMQQLRGDLDAAGKPDLDGVVALLRARLSESLRTTIPEIGEDGVGCILLLGVNGVGKTTSVAKLAQYYKERLGANNILLAAADTFRAGAIDQLKIHGERLGIRVVAQGPGADPGAVAFDALESARARGAKLVLVDTAGRLHNKANLVKELQKIDKVIRGRIEGNSYHKALVLDATTGQNAVAQADIFHDAVGVDSVILAKYDSTAKAGSVIAVSQRLGIPISFVGIGEGPGDFRAFDAEEFLDALLGQP